MVEAIKLCDQPKDIAELEKLEAMIETFKNPRTFIAHVGKDISINGVDIFKHIKTGVAEFQQAQYYNFGKDMGDALAETLIGTIQMEQKEKKMNPKFQEAIDIVSGILEGAIDAEGLDNIEGCVKDGELILEDTYDAIV